jgi:PPM family protein phosphatase
MGAERHIRLNCSARTSVGQVRDNNEDSLRLWNSAEFALAVVADGMGGAAAGEEASGLAVQAVENALAQSEYANRAHLETLTDEFITLKMQDAIKLANTNIVQLASSHPEKRGMGTTVTLAFIRGTHALLAHVGDSRAYHIQAAVRRITQVTADHSFVEALVAAGHLTHEQAEEHPMKNVLYRALGQSEEVEVDIYSIQLDIDDRIVLCSDGLTRHVKPAEIGEIGLRFANPEDASAAMIDLANQRGGEDNVSVIIVKVEADGPDDPNEISTIELKPITLEDEDTLRLKTKPLGTLPDAILGTSDAEGTLKP